MELGTEPGEHQLTSLNDRQTISPGETAKSASETTKHAGKHIQITLNTNHGFHSGTYS